MSSVKSSFVKLL